MEFPRAGRALAAQQSTSILCRPAKPGFQRTHNPKNAPAGWVELCLPGCTGGFWGRKRSQRAGEQDPTPAPIAGNLSTLRSPSPSATTPCVRRIERLPGTVQSKPSHCTDLRDTRGTLRATSQRGRGSESPASSTRRAHLHPRPGSGNMLEAS
uniref:Uncharacterized protein n=1 Tax=Ficedula albicollis TaxID=59894 RepID=A0A803VNF6_FICAL